jgi:hypothetical protein
MTTLSLGTCCAINVMDAITATKRVKNVRFIIKIFDLVLFYSYANITIIASEPRIQLIY